MPRQPGFRNALHNLPILVLSTVLICVSGCNYKKAKYASPPGYDLNKPYAYPLPEILNEISGVVYYAKDSSLFAIQDEKGWLFKIHLSSPLHVERWKFSSGGDYEDVALVDTTFFVLKSKGIIEKFKFISGDSLAIESFKLPENVKNEFESLYYDSTLHQLILMCKNCESDGKSQVTSFFFNPLTNSFSSAFVIETERIREQLGENERFKPSAAAIHPLTGELYILASVNHALVILNKDHSVKSTYIINPSLFKQPEGLTFTPKGDMIISNESAERGTAANILFFKYNKPTQK